MKDFAELYRKLDETTSTNRKIDAMVDYFQRAPERDAIWTVSFLIGRKPRQVVPARKLMQWAAELARIPEWLFEASYDVVGDLAETITLLLPGLEGTSDRSLHEWVELNLLPLRELEPESQRSEILSAWNQMDESQRFVWNKLITGGFRVGVSRRLVVRALERFSGIDAAVITHRLMGEWPATADTYRRILSPDTQDADISRPYPFYLAYPLADNVDDLGSLDRWQVEWKWDGIRGQVIKRSQQVFIWSRGEELVTEKYPELADSIAVLPDGTVLDGEILPWRDGRPLPFSELQRRIGRKTVGKKLLKEVPTAFLAYDVMEFGARGSAPKAAAAASKNITSDALKPSGKSYYSIPGCRSPDLARAGNSARGIPSAWGRGVYPKTTRFGLWGRASARRLVEVENRSSDCGCGSDLRPAGPRKTGRSFHRLHFRRLAG